MKSKNGIKKFFSVVCTTMLAAVCVTSLGLKPHDAHAACSHQFNGSYQTTWATCTKNGQRVGKCTKCGKVLNRQVLYATGHNWVDKQVVQTRSCTRNGIVIQRCTKCGTTRTNTLYAPGHASNGSYTVTKQSTCTTDGQKVLKCTRAGCGAVLNTQSIPKTGHSYSYFYNVKTGKLSGFCTRSGCGHQDLDVTYNEFLSNGNLKNNTDNQRKYLQYIASSINGVTVDQLLNDKAAANAQCGGNISKTLDKCGEVLGFVIDATQPGLESYIDGFDVIEGTLGNYDNASKLLTAYKGMSTAMTLSEFLECNDKTPTDLVSIICTAASFGDSDFGVLSKELAQMPELFDKSVEKAKKYEDRKLYCAYLDNENVTVKVGGVTKPLYEVSLYDIYEYPYTIKGAFSGCSTQDANKMYKFLRESKEAYIAYLIMNPGYNGDYETFCQENL